VTGLKLKTHQMAQAEDVVLSREAMEMFGLISNLDDRREASVRHLSTTPANGGGDGSTPVESGGPPGFMGSCTHISCQIKATPTADRHRSAVPNGGSGRAAPPNGGTSGDGSTHASGAGVLSSSLEYRQYGEDLGVPGGQLTLDLIAAHNQDFSKSNYP
jgi:hypothetical protein